MLLLCCPLYSLELVPGKHCAESLTTTMSVCSRDTGYSREMGRHMT